MSSTKKGPTTAAELLRDLDNDPEYQKMIREKDEIRNEQAKKLQADEAELVKEINELGLKITSVWDFVNNTPHQFLKRVFVGPYEQAYPILVQHLDKEHHKAIKEGIIRALTEKDAREIAKDKLLEYFYKETDLDLKWVTANALTILLTRGEKQKHPAVKKVRWGK